MVSSEEKKFIDDETMGILRFLNLPRKNGKVVDQLNMVMTMYKFVVQNVDERLEGSSVGMQFGEEFEANYARAYYSRLIGALKCNDGSEFSNAVLLNYLFYMKGFDSYVLLSRSRNGFPHISTVAQVGDDYYYFDAKQDRMIYKNQDFGMPEEFSFMSAGLGREEYEGIYTPKKVYPNFYDKRVRVPTTLEQIPIADKGILRSLIEQERRKIPDLTYHRERHVQKAAEHERDEERLM